MIWYIDMDDNQVDAVLYKKRLHINKKFPLNQTMYDNYGSLEGTSEMILFSMRNSFFGNIFGSGKYFLGCKEHFCHR